MVKFKVGDILKYKSLDHYGAIYSIKAITPTGYKILVYKVDLGDFPFDFTHANFYKPNSCIIRKRLGIK